MLISQRSRAVDVSNGYRSIGIENGFDVNYDYNPNRYTDTYQLGENISDKTFNEQDVENMTYNAGALEKANIVRSEYLKSLNEVIRHTVAAHSGDMKFAQQMLQSSERLHEGKNQLFSASMDAAFKTTGINQRSLGAIAGYKTRFRNAI